MSMASDEGRFQGEGSGPTAYERDEAEMQVDRVDELRQLGRDTFRLIARELAAIKMLDMRKSGLGTETEEIAEGASDEAESLFLRLLDTTNFRDAREIASGDDL